MSLVSHPITFYLLDPFLDCLQENFQIGPYSTEDHRTLDLGSWLEN